MVTENGKAGKGKDGAQSGGSGPPSNQAAGAAGGAASEGASGAQVTFYLPSQASRAPGGTPASVWVVVGDGDTQGSGSNNGGGRGGRRGQNEEVSAASHGGCGRCNPGPYMGRLAWPPQPNQCRIHGRSRRDPPMPPPSPPQ